MVNALLDGRKTQTRRIMKPQPSYDFGWYPGCGDDGKSLYYFTEKHFKNVVRDFTPHGKTGDRLWVRETFRIFDSSDECGCSESPCNCPANGSPLYRANADCSENKWKPSIHMPRWASRILLEVVDVRVERLNEISEEDAMAEGWPKQHGDFDSPAPGNGGVFDWYRDLWEKINGEGSWDKNPWVWVIEFKVIKGLSDGPKINAT